jgi:NADH-quinone oxidoreductase subunit N
VLALLFGGFLVSLAGAPPMAGLIAKLFVFAATIEAEVYWLAIVMGVNTVIAAWYYLAVIKKMFFETPEIDEPVEVPYLMTAAMGLATAVLVGLLIYPALLIDLADRSIF